MGDLLRLIDLGYGVNGCCYLLAVFGGSEARKITLAYSLTCATYAYYVFGEPRHFSLRQGGSHVSCVPRHHVGLSKILHGE